MKLTTSDSARFFTKPDLSKTGVLLFGPDPMRIALKRQALIALALGKEPQADMRLTRVTGADLRKTPALATDALKAISFFEGRRVVWIEDANENCSTGVLQALKDWRDGDAFLVVTAGNLPPKSKIRKAFESDKNAYAIGIYANPPSLDEIAQTIKKAGIHALTPDAQSAVNAYANALDPGDFAQFIEKLSLYCLHHTAPVEEKHIEACAPASVEAHLDDIVAKVADARTDQLSTLVQRLAAQGTNPTALCISVLRHFKMLHTIASDPAGIGKVFPPLNGPRRTAAQRQANRWGRARLEQAISMLLETDLKLRSEGQKAPQMALTERCLIRLTMLGR